MIIQCPACRTKFSVDSRQLAEVESPRFHCSRCGTIFELSAEEIRSGIQHLPSPFGELNNENQAKSPTEFPSETTEVEEDLSEPEEPPQEEEEPPQEENEDSGDVSHNSLVADPIAAEELDFDLLSSSSEAEQLELLPREKPGSRAKTREMHSHELAELRRVAEEGTEVVAEWPSTDSSDLLEVDYAAPPPERQVRQRTATRVLAPDELPRAALEPPQTVEPQSASTIDDVAQRETEQREINPAPRPLLSEENEEEATAKLTAVSQVSAQRKRVPPSTIDAITVDWASPGSEHSVYETTIGIEAREALAEDFSPLERSLKAPTKESFVRPPETAYHESEKAQEIQEVEEEPFPDFDSFEVEQQQITEELSADWGEQEELPEPQIFPLNTAFDEAPVEELKEEEERVITKPAAAVSLGGPGKASGSMSEKMTIKAKLDDLVGVQAAAMVRAQQETEDNSWNEDFEAGSDWEKIKVAGEESKPLKPPPESRSDLRSVLSDRILAQRRERDERRKDDPGRIEDRSLSPQAGTRPSPSGSLPASSFRVTDDEEAPDFDESAFDEIADEKLKRQVKKRAKEQSKLLRDSLRGAKLVMGPKAVILTCSIPFLFLLFLSIWAVFFSSTPAGIRSLLGLRAAETLAPRNLAVEAPSSSLITLDSGERVLSIQGKISNKTSKTYRGVKLEGALYDSENVLLQKKIILLNNALGEAPLAALKLENIETFQEEPGLGEDAISPNTEKPFRVVFTSLSGKESFFSARVYSVLASPR